MIKPRLTKHFIERWRQRIGCGLPPPCLLGSLIKDPCTLRLQKGKRLKTLAGDKYHTLSIYFYAPSGLILFIDHYHNTAVSVMTTVGRN